MDLISKYALVSYGRCQKIIIDEHSWWDDIADCSNGGLPSFNETDVGTEPAGVSINGPAFQTDETTGVDTVTISAVFDDDKLCQAVASIAGSSCNKNGTKYRTDVVIKQN